MHQHEGWIDSNVMLGLPSVLSTNISSQQIIAMCRCCRVILHCCWLSSLTGVQQLLMQMDLSMPSSLMQTW